MPRGGQQFFQVRRQKQEIPGIAGVACETVKNSEVVVRERELEKSELNL